MDSRLGLTAIAVVILAVAVGLLAGRTQSQTVAAPAPTAIPTVLSQPPVGYINIDGYSTSSKAGFYLPRTFTGRVGHKITWVNTAPAYHSVVSDDGTTFNSGPITPGSVFEWTPKKPGRWHYTDIFNPDMSAEIIVKP